MEYDRYQKNHGLFITGMVSLVICLALFSLLMYVAPNLLFGWRYSIPSFITFSIGWMVDTYSVTELAAARIIFLIGFILAWVFAFIAYISSNRIDNEIYHDELPEAFQPMRPKTEDHEGMRVFVKILIFIALVFIIASILEWIIYTPPAISFMKSSNIKTE